MHLWVVVSHLWAQLWALVSYLKHFNVELHIDFLRKRLIIYAIHEDTPQQNVGSWNWGKVFLYGTIDAKSFYDVRKYEVFIFLVKLSDSFCLAIVTIVNDFCPFLFYRAILRKITIFFRVNALFFHFTKKTKTPSSSEVDKELISKTIRQTKGNFYVWVQK